MYFRPPRRFFIEHERAPDKTVMFTLLSLFIILLSFFIVLGAHNTYNQDKSKTVINSLGKTFASELFPGQTGVGFEADFAGGQGNGYALQDLGKMFSAEIEGIEPQLIPSRGFLSLEFNISDFRNIVKSMKGGTGPTTLSATLNRALKGEGIDAPQLQMEIWLSAKADFASALENDELQNMADQWVAGLTAKGIGGARMSLGVSPEVKAGKILLLFRPYYPYGVRG